MVGHVREEGFVLVYLCKIAVPEEGVGAPSNLRCGTLTFCKMPQYLACRLVGAIHFFVGARVPVEAFFVSQLTSCNKQILKPEDLMEQIIALHAEAQRQERWLYWKCNIDASNSQSVVRKDTTWSAASERYASWTGWWDAEPYERSQPDTVWYGSSGALQRDVRPVAAEMTAYTGNNYRSKTELWLGQDAAEVEHIPNPSSARAPAKSNDVADATQGCKPQHDVPVAVRAGYDNDGDDGSAALADAGRKRPRHVRRTAARLADDSADVVWQ